MAPRTRYARSGNLSIPYQVVGDGPVDLVHAPPFVSQLEWSWEWTPLVLHRSGYRANVVEQSRYVAARIPGARLVELPGVDHLQFVGDADADAG